mmetsp:Transcript_21348/g.34174  ORF Transcript_21348/g.34174 Transcript_21348/m.34174 type:complete len:287 (+) Transcript_21348:168-1028(+)
MRNLNRSSFAAPFILIDILIVTVFELAHNGSCLIISISILRSSHKSASQSSCILLIMTVLFFLVFVVHLFFRTHRILFHQYLNISFLHDLHIRHPIISRLIRHLLESTVLLLLRHRSLILALLHTKRKRSGSRLFLWIFVLCVVTPIDIGLHRAISTASLLQLSIVRVSSVSLCFAVTATTHHGTAKKERHQQRNHDLRLLAERQIDIVHLVLLPAGNRLDIHLLGVHHVAHILCLCRIDHWRLRLWLAIELRSLWLWSSHWWHWTDWRRVLRVWWRIGRLQRRQW